MEGFQRGEVVFPTAAVGEICHVVACVYTVSASTHDSNFCFKAGCLLVRHEMNALTCSGEICLEIYFNFITDLLLSNTEISPRRTCRRRL